MGNRRAAWTIAMLSLPLLVWAALVGPFGWAEESQVAAAVQSLITLAAAGAAIAGIRSSGSALRPMRALAGIALLVGASGEVVRWLGGPVAAQQVASLTFVALAATAPLLHPSARRPPQGWATGCCHGLIFSSAMVIVLWEGFIAEAPLRPPEFDRMLSIAEIGIGFGLFTAISNAQRRTATDLWLLLAGLSLLVPADISALGYGPSWTHQRSFGASVTVALASVFAFAAFLIRGNSESVERSQPGSFTWATVLLILAAVPAAFLVALRMSEGRALRAESAIAGIVLATAALATVLLAIRHSITLARSVEASTKVMVGREARFRALLARSADLVITADVSGRITYATPAARRLLGGAPEDLFGQCVDDLVTFDDRGALTEVVRTSVRRRGEPVGSELRWRRTDGTIWPTETTVTCLLDDPALREYVLNVHDIEARNAYERALQDRAERDPLTGLANRDLLRDVASRIIGTGPIGVLLMDLDDFKQVNDTLGHGVGDDLLREVGRRLELAIGARGVVGRLGGDEFAAVLPGVGSPEEAETIGADLTTAIRELWIDGRRFRAAGSVGVAVDSYGRLTFDELLLRADQAMYVAKASSRGGVARFDHRLQRANHERHELEREVTQALTNGELVAYFQPVVSLEDGLPTGAEVLVRWDHPRLGMLPPVRFLGMIDQLGLARDLETLMIRQAAETMREVRRFGLDDFRMAVNLSAVGLADVSLAAFVLGAVDETTMAATELTVEITEGTLLDRLDDIAAELAILRARGVHVALDDFGTGFSSLAYLGKLPVDVLKLDRQFILDAPTGSAQRRLLQGVVRLGLDLHLNVLAEGVEDAITEDMVRALGCQRAQGFFYAKPLHGSGLVHWLADRIADVGLGNGVEPGAARLHAAAATGTAAGRWTAARGN